MPVGSASALPGPLPRPAAGALSLTRNPPLAPPPCERMLLDRCVRGNLTIGQVLAPLAAQAPG